MEIEYLDLVDTIERLRKISKKLNIAKILDGNAAQIEIISEIKSRLEKLIIERVNSVDLGISQYRS
jgi:hypothetical protein